MHTVTFYSFKGGVGRSLALANVAHELASSGERVLLVDFDLEAPGLDTLFEAPSARTPGLVEFVTDYLKNESPPDVLDYVEEVGTLSEDAPMFLMSAGIQDDTYARRLSNINWVELYERYDGYLMFEDLKAQWAKKLGVSYVLIDSRTGHTDVGGICTRHLPDVVVAVFFPNMQNLRGLTKVVEEIRAEPDASQRDPVDLLFVASDVPRLDDEERILHRTLRAFSRRLDIKDAVHTVHHYDSLALLERPIFTRDRPKTRLAKQYAQLARRIRMTNVEDRKGVLARLEQGPMFLDETPELLFNRLSRIEAQHSSDGEVLFELAKVRSSFGQISEATAILEEAVETYSKPHVRLNLAENYQRLGVPDKAAGAAASVFDDSSADLDVLLRAVELLRLTDPDEMWVRQIGDSAAAQGLSPTDRVELAHLLNRSRVEREVAWEMIEPLLRRAGRPEPWAGDALITAAFVAIALQKFEEARRYLEERLQRHPDEVPSLFNYAMAGWGLHGDLRREEFEEVLEHSLRRLPSTPNYFQCMAVAKAAAHQPEEALIELERARGAIQQRSAAEFSCWRYLDVPPRQFLRDLGKIEDWIKGADSRPDFLSPQDQLTLGPGTADTAGKSG